MELEALISVPEAAKLLGVHPNTIRNRIKAGQYTAEWTQSPHGPKQLVPRDQVLGVSMPTGDEHPYRAIAFIEPRTPNGDVGLQQILSPFLERLESTMIEVGALRESKRFLEDSNQKLEAELERLQEERRRRQTEVEHLRLLADAAKQSEPAAVAPPPRSWWQRVFSLT